MRIFLVEITKSNAVCAIFFNDLLYVHQDQNRLNFGIKKLYYYVLNALFTPTETIASTFKLKT